jgi:hypothetical protein
MWTNPNIHVCVYVQIRVITKLPNSEQSYKGKVKTHKYINRKKSVNNRKTVKTVMTLTWYRHFNKNVKNICLSMCDVKVSLTFTSLSLALLWQLFYLFCSSIVINTVYANKQTNTNNVNKTWALIHTTGGKNELKNLRKTSSSSINRI